MLRGILKAAAISVLGSAGAVAVKLRVLRSTGKLTVLNLHRIGPDDGSAYPALRVDLFEDLLRFITKNFEVVTFSDTASRGSTKPKLILSFDDGYADFFENAMPLLKKYGLSANLNIIPECVENGRPPLNVELEDLIGKAPMAVLAKVAIPGLPLDLTEPRNIIGHKVTAYIKNLNKAAQNEIRDAVDAQVGEWLSQYTSRMMTRDEVIEAAKTHEIGAHSYSHASLGREDDVFLREDIRLCQRYFKTRLGQQMTIYAVPNGSYREEQLRILANEGVKSILIVDERFSEVGATIHRRFTFYATSTKEIIYRALGAYRWPIGSTNLAITRSHPAKRM